MKSMKTSVLGMGISLIMLGSCATKDSQSVLTLSGLNPANFETLVDGVKPVKAVHIKKCQRHGSMCYQFRRPFSISHGTR